ncbi:hypothetical protein BGX33_000533 [Mortierella sp. NVP41]|nr:hypothetical protein BGX33_000533 [Mortierella sp. NVP41]
MAERGKRPRDQFVSPRQGPSKTRSSGTHSFTLNTALPNNSTTSELRSYSLASNASLVTPPTIDTPSAANTHPATGDTPSAIGNNFTSRSLLSPTLQQARQAPPELQVPEAAISAFVNVSEHLEDHAKELLPAQDQDQDLMETDLEDVILDAGKIGGQEGSKDSVDKDEEQFIKIESVDEQQTTSSSRNKEGPRRPSMSAAVGPKNRSQFTDAQEEIGALSRIVAAQEQRINELEEVVAIMKDESRRREFMTTDKYHQLRASLAYFRNSS